MHLVPAWVGEKIRIPVATLELIAPCQVRGVEGESQLLSPILGGQTDVQARVQGSLYHVVREPFDPDIDPNVPPRVLDGLIDAVPEGNLLG